jgi:hypothetical protein
MSPAFIKRLALKILAFTFEKAVNWAFVPAEVT